MKIPQQCPSILASACYNPFMYKEFYHFRENPFNVTADPEFFFSSQRHTEAFSHLLYGIQQRKGIIVISGEIGTGKTILCRTLLTRLGSDVKTALILNPNFSEIQLLKSIIQDWGIPGEFRSKFDLMNALNTFLMEQNLLGNNVVLIIDEAQNLNIKQLEQIRLLSNLETEKEKLLQLVLVGQPELEDKLNQPELRQLNQRVTVRFHMTPLKKEEVGQYITHRISHALVSAQRAQRPVFTPTAVERIYNMSQGTPRVINILCDRALLAGFTAETSLIDEHIIQRCIAEVVHA
ncbi:MAG: AAA family ATPase [Candidatus Omnitrophota bacterium]|nr:AAA family ATPase [Candidatus Omnitrophota bacterium]